MTQFSLNFRSKAQQAPQGKFGHEAFEPPESAGCAGWRHQHRRRAGAVGHSRGRHAGSGANSDRLDWSSRAVIHRQPLAPDELKRRGRDAELQQRYRDPRYVASVLRRFEAEQRRPSLGQQAKSGETASRGRDRHRDPRKPPSSW
ncbi:hypothetical protein [Thermomonas sp.]|uniref:hypothetical protein n=1 Tax=Thermomonas sp. TaxID=1971895 RepID=UPI00261EE770|nr:hypothetical protein [Thermomonas sp.]MBL0227573.1 hypothetical protein [Thermomonas sp.]